MNPKQVQDDPVSFLGFANPPSRVLVQANKHVHGKDRVYHFSTTWAPRASKYLSAAP